MLKKAGFIVAASVAGLLAVSPLAFAGDDTKDDGNGYQLFFVDDHCEGEQETRGGDAGAIGAVVGAVTGGANAANVNVACNSLTQGG